MVMGMIFQLLGGNLYIFALVWFGSLVPEHMRFVLFVQIINFGGNSVYIETGKRFKNKGENWSEVIIK